MYLLFCKCTTERKLLRTKLTEATKCLQRSSNGCLTLLCPFLAEGIPLGFITHWLQSDCTLWSNKQLAGCPPELEENCQTCQEHQPSPKYHQQTVSAQASLCSRRKRAFGLSRKCLPSPTQTEKYSFYIQASVLLRGRELPSSFTVLQKGRPLDVKQTCLGKL